MVFDENETLTVDSSPTGAQNVEAEAPSLEVEKFSDAERKDWLENRVDFPKKEKPAKEIKTEAAESSTADAPEGAETADEASDSATEDKTQEIPKVKVSPAEERIKDLLAKNKILESRLKVVERPKETEPAKVEVKPEPRAEDFETVDAYLKALTDHRVSEAIRIDRESQRNEVVKAETDAKNKEIADRWNSQVDESKKKHKDFDEVALSEATNVIEGSVLDRWLINSDLGAEMLYHYGKNLDDLAALNKMSPFDAARELTKLELKLSEAPQVERAKPAPAKVTQAPPPPSIIATKGVTDAKAAAIAAGDMGTYLRLRKAEGFK